MAPLISVYVHVSNQKKSINRPHFLQQLVQLPGFLWTDPDFAVDGFIDVLPGTGQQPGCCRREGNHCFPAVGRGGTPLHQFLEYELIHDPGNIRTFFDHSGGDVAHTHVLRVLAVEDPQDVVLFVRKSVCLEGLAQRGLQPPCGVEHIQHGFMHFAVESRGFKRLLNFHGTNICMYMYFAQYPGIDSRSGPPTPSIEPLNWYTCRMNGMEENPWQVHRQELRYDNRWIALTESQVTTPAGTPGIYGVVHFKNKAIGILAIDQQHHTWLVGQWRFPLNTWSWEIPEGGGPLDVDPLESAQRELREETGLLAADWSLLLRSHLSNSVSDEEGFIFLARQLTQSAHEREDTEADMRVLRLPFREAFDRVMSGDITDSLSIMAILKAAHSHPEFLNDPDR